MEQLMKYTSLDPAPRPRLVTTESLPPESILSAVVSFRQACCITPQPQSYVHNDTSVIIANMESNATLCTGDTFIRIDRASLKWRYCSRRAPVRNQRKPTAVKYAVQSDISILHIWSHITGCNFISTNCAASILVSSWFNLAEFQLAQSNSWDPLVLATSQVVSCEEMNMPHLHKQTESIPAVRLHAYMVWWLGSWSEGRRVWFPGLPVASLS